MAQEITRSEWNANMDAEDHVATYQGFLSGAKWSVAILIVVLVGMAIFLL
ncbi:MAG TPA: aa3-type cytochrome c oxidase subunit IV [Parvibaculum sp.]|nr:aa3-type cytochrome c oxidase subunit IV [Parvibaculum sp.]HMM13110.1 aa3-type cytochrome c oxidase subunit IV [Parvibaculum sp.]